MQILFSLCVATLRALSSEKSQKNGFQHGMNKKYCDAEQSKATNFQGIFLHEIMVIKRL